MTQAEHDHDDEQTSEVYPSEAQDMAIALRQASKRAVWYRTGEHALLARAADFIEGASGQQAAESARDLDQPRTRHRVTQEAPASDWSSEGLKPYMEALDVSAKMLAPLTMTTTEMAARNTKTRKEAHDLDVAGYAAGCPHCPDGHRVHQPWGAWVRPHRDSDGQPVSITVMPSAGAHVAESDAEWIQELLNHHDLDVDHAVALEREEWAQFFEQFDATVGRPELTPELIASLMRGPRPFGAYQAEGGDLIDD